MTARLNGKQVGRKKGVGFETKKAREAKQILRTHCKTFGGTLDDAECMKLIGLARNTKRTLPAYPRYVLPALQFPL